MKPRPDSFGARTRSPRPVLLLIVLGVFLVIVGVTATAEAMLVSAYSSRTAFDAVVSSDLATVRGFVEQGLDPRIATDPALVAQDQQSLQALMGTLTSKGEILRVELRTPDGTIVADTDPSATGAVVPPSEQFQSAVDQGTAAVDIEAADQAEAGPGTIDATNVLREYMPLSVGGHVALVVALYRDAAPLLQSLDGLRSSVVAIILTAALIIAVMLFFIFRAAQARISRQTKALVEAQRRDPLTETLSHGALVGYLAQEIEAGRASGAVLDVALLDVDNFRLVNDTYTHRAGDEVLLAVAREIAAELPPEMVLGRYGPDEFLIVRPPASGADLVTIVERIRARLAAMAMPFESTEKLPVTVSAGICSFPKDATSVTALLSLAAQTSADARASGGDVVRIAGASAEMADTVATSFDVLQGLVFAVDTKDRYTKRHSQEVARYAVFLGRQIGLDEDELKTLHIAGLLHDIGKIGIPDAILRKPGRLTSDEMDIVKQHVALGDMVVRDLPNIGLVRAGIRGHHERWDGRGYLDGLSGKDIPHIARVLAVADAFSAMTTTRPYRKALDVREALHRLGDAAGSQLDEQLVKTFIQALETVPDAPIPNADIPTHRLWVPSLSA
jgi:diguanylate cyclase (GGDEF)-like protein